MLGYTNLDSEKGFAFFQRFLKEGGILEELEKAGIEEGNTVRMYGFDFDYYKQQKGRKNMTSKQRAYLKSLAMKMDPIMQLGKGSVTPENTASVDEALAARELIKISVLQNCLDDPRQMAEVLAERTHSEVVQVIGRKIVLYREGKKDKKKIILP